MLRKEIKGIMTAKRYILIPVIASALLLTACGGSKKTESLDRFTSSNAEAENAAAAAEMQSDSTDDSSGEVPYDSTSFFPFGETFYDGKWFSGELTDPVGARSADDIYIRVNYTPQMFYGDFRLNHPDDGLPTSYASKRFMNKCGFIQGSTVSSLLANRKISAVPYRIVAGSELEAPWVNDTSNDWCQLFFAVPGDESTGESIYAAYSILNRTITFTPVAEYSVDESTGKLTYRLEETPLTYNFEFRGPRLTLSNENGKYTLIERDFTSWRSYITEESITVTSSLSEKTQMIGDITGIDMTITLNSDGTVNPKKSAFIIKVNKRGQKWSNNGIARWDEDGVLTFSYKDQVGVTRSYSYVMFYCGVDGIILTDGKVNYYYLPNFHSQDSLNHYSIDTFGANASKDDVEQFEYLTDEQVEAALETRNALITDLKKAFTNNGIAATVDEQTGEVLLDSSVLFATAESELSEEGMYALQGFINTFAGVISNQKYNGFLSEVEIQGHTDTDGNYDYNMRLSQERADSVKKYCLNEAGLTKELKDKISGLLISKGYSYDDPIYNADGTVNMDASRRVSFVFRINLSGKSN